jgi:DNA-binding GntR family transcriptional regulator
MRESSAHHKTTGAQNGEKVPFMVVKKLRKAILDETLKPGDHLLEEELAERFEVSRSPVREALLALEKEGTVIIAPYKGAILKPLSPEEALDIAELRLALISLVAKPAHRHLSPADFDLAQEIARRISRTRSAIDYSEDTMRFWDMIFQKSQRPILPEVFAQLHRRTTRYYPLFINLFPDRSSKPTHREVFIELYREGKIGEALRVFKKMYLEVIDQVIGHLRSQEVGIPALKGCRFRT